MSRPRIPITEDQLRQIEAAAGLGLTEAMIARLVGHAPRTFRTKKGLRPDVSAALERGQAKAAAKVGKALFDKALKGDVPAITWWERTRLKLGETTRVEHSGPDGAPINVRLTPTEIKDRIAVFRDLALRRMGATSNGNGNGKHA